MSFFDKLDAAIAHNQSLLTVDLSPDLDTVAASREVGFAAIASTLDQQTAVLKTASTRLHGLIDASADLVCAYSLSLETFRIFGAEGLSLLQDILGAIPPHIPVILDAKHGDPNTSTVFAELAFEAWQVDAVTLLPYTGQDQVAPFLVDPNKAVFLLTATGNPAAAALQQFPTAEQPFYLHLIAEAKTWGTMEQVCLELGTVTPDMIRRIRAIAPERTLWLNGRWDQDTDWTALLQAGLNSNGSGILCAAPSYLLTQPQPHQSIASLRDQIDKARSQLIQTSPLCSVWTPNVCFLQPHPYEDLVLQLYDIGFLRFGEFVKASGAVFPYYIDLRVIISNPQVFDAVISAYSAILRGLTFDRIAGIPYGSLPTATGLSLHLNKPMIFPRKEVKAHGAKRLVEGHYHPGETAVLVDDILISGKSAIAGAKKLESVGLTIRDIVVLIDHEQGVQDRIRQQGYNPYAVLKLSDIATTLAEAGRISEDQMQILLADC
jgi:uridine monophosphate synthetase